MPVRLSNPHLVEGRWLEQRLDDDRVRIVDVRGTVRTATGPGGEQTAAYLGRREDYLQQHIPGAVYLDWTVDLVDLDDPIPAQAAGPRKAEEVFSASGIDAETLVVAYDDHPASQFATRLWWLLRYHGHSACAVLNGGWPLWLREGRPVCRESRPLAPRRFRSRLQPDWRADAAQVTACIGDGTTLLLDARDPGQFTGAIRRGPRGGRIPGAVNLPRERLVDPSGRFLSEAELSELAREVGAGADRPVIAYCNGGVAATSVLFALSLVGCRRLRNYDGSWNEWSGRHDLPVDPGE